MEDKTYKDFMDAIQSEFNCDTVESGKNQGKDEYTPSKKPFRCPKCSNAFTTLSSFKAHERIHSAKTLLKCSQCDYKSSGNLKRHERTHTGDKPFSCSQCD